ncbi:MAG: hypothetical protein QXF29_04520 [Archaeoglobaceae archaeon]
MRQILFLLFLIPASALTVSYEVTPEIVLPNGYADCVVKIVNDEVNEVKINSISFLSSSVEVTPNHVAVGKLGPKSIYTLKVSMKPNLVGRQIVEMFISGENFTISQPIEILVDDKFPEIAISSPLYRGEVKNVTLLLSSPVLLNNVRVEAMFNATPRIFLFPILSGAVQFNLRFGEDLDELRFKISFYNGKSYHVIERSIKTSYIPSKGILTNLQISKNILYLGEAVNISIEITNLRNDEVYDIEVIASGKGKFSHDYRKIEKLGAGEKRVLNFTFSPRENGDVDVEVLICYRDYFGQRYEKKEKISLTVLESEVLQITNLREEGFIGKLRLSGDVINYGHTRVMGVVISAICNESKTDYLIGKIEANDYETFDLETNCGEILLKLSWWNEAGDSFSKFEVIKRRILPETGKSTAPMVIATTSAIAVIVLVIYIILRSRK